MSSTDSFVENFQKDHLELLKLITSFRKAIESSNSNEAKNILSEIENITTGHFEFEETYLYPRLRRLILEITQRLRNEQQMMREFISSSKGILNMDRLSKNKISNLLDILPKLTTFFEECNTLVFLAEKFNPRDKEDLNRRFKDCSRTKNLVTV